MNKRKAKALRKLAKQVVLNGGRPIHEIGLWYKQMKKAYKHEKSKSK